MCCEGNCAKGRVDDGGADDVCDVHVCVPLFVWVGITFLPLYLASVYTCTCISLYVEPPSGKPKDSSLCINIDRVR